MKKTLMEGRSTFPPYFSPWPAGFDVCGEAVHSMTARKQRQEAFGCLIPFSRMHPQWPLYFSHQALPFQGPPLPSSTTDGLPRLYTDALSDALDPTQDTLLLLLFWHHIKACE